MTAQGQKWPLCVIVALGATLIGCEHPLSSDSAPTIGTYYRVVTVEGCEYIEYDRGVLDQRVYSLTHKGNCKNPIHCR